MLAARSADMYHWAWRDGHLPVLCIDSPLLTSSGMQSTASFPRCRTENATPGVGYNISLLPGHKVHGAKQSPVSIMQLYPYFEDKTVSLNLYIGYTERIMSVFRL